MDNVVVVGGIEDCKGETKSARRGRLEGGRTKGRRIFGSRVEQIALRRPSDTITLFKAHERAFDSASKYCCVCCVYVYVRLQVCQIIIHMNM